MRHIDRFLSAYITAALWSSTDNDDNPLDDEYTIDDIAPETLDRMAEDCARFKEQSTGLFSQDQEESAAHDFWLTRNGHGAGFWDGDWPENGDKLTEISESFRECELYVGDDGKIYC